MTHFKPNMRFSLKIVKIWILFLALSPNLLAETLSQEEIQRLLKRVEVLQFDGRDMAQVPLKLILEVALERTLAFKSLALSEEAAQTQVIGARERNHPTLQTSFGYSNSASLSSASGGSESSVNTISTTFSKKLDNGMSYGFTLSERNTQSTTLVAEDWSSVESTTSSDPYSQSSLSANLKVPFFKDAGFEVNNLPVKLAEIGVERAYWNSRSSKLGLLQALSLIHISEPTRPY